MFLLKIFRRNKRVTPVGGLFEMIRLKTQKRMIVVANKLQQWSLSVSRRRLYLYLVGFCLLFISYGVLTIYLSLKYTQAKKIQAISSLSHVSQSKEQLSSPDGPEMQRILRFKNFVDSIRIVDKVKYDSLSNARPGLLDSLELVISNYKR